MNPNIERALLLYDQSRHEMAENELRQALASDPHEPFAHALLSLCLLNREHFKEATEEAQQAIHLAPDLAFAHYALASVYRSRNRNPDALASIQEALRLDPSDADYFALLAAIHFDERRWPDSLAAAEHGLQMDSEHIACTNMRAMALVKLGRRAEAGAAIGAALARNPEDSVTHANQGWALLEAGNPNQALEHFREALRLDAENEWARAGIVEALKARNVIYALLLKYFLWMAGLSSRAQWGVVVGGYIGNRLLGTLAAKIPAMAPWVLPLRILYVVFALLTWTADPLFNLLLRLNRFGKLALNREQIVASNWVGSFLLIALLALAGYIVSGSRGQFLLVAFVFGFLVMPLAGTFKCASGWPRRVMAIYTGAMAVVGIAALVLLLTAAPGRVKDAPPAVALLGLFFMAAIASGWVANILIAQRPRR